MKTTAERIKEAMELRGLKQIDLVEKTKISKGALSSYISGKYAPKQNNLFLIAKALNVSEAWLMGYDVPMEKNNEGYIYTPSGDRQMTLFGALKKDGLSIDIPDIPDTMEEDILNFYSFDTEEMVENISNCQNHKLDEILQKISEVPINKLDNLLDILDMFTGDLDFNLQLLNDELSTSENDDFNEQDLLELNQYISCLNTSGKKEMLNRIEELTQIKKYTETEEKDTPNDK